MDKKSELRIAAKNVRKSLDIQSVSQVLVERVRANEVYRRSKNVMIYYPTRFEVDLLSLLEDDKNFYFPRVDNQDLQVCPYKNGVKFEKSGFNILEPCSNPVESKILDLIIVPALMVDKKGFRLGYGGGFYDRFLAGMNDNVQTLCALPKELFVNELPHEEFDIPVDLVILDK
ncbi:MAG: 5-formyltetrahydrofolate cyclo-ligase [Muribaculaceae bacterium]|nr:5-formyltetrahydrofolate cyclo-ligase [Muribaculaceae bacterium]